MPPALPAWRTRADVFDDLVLAGVERLERRWADRIAGTELMAIELIRDLGRRGIQRSSHQRCRWFHKQ